jgi:hypothetical protein
VGEQPSPLSLLHAGSLKKRVTKKKEKKVKKKQKNTPIALAIVHNPKRYRKGVCF